MTDELENFKRKYRAHVQPGHRRYAVPKRMSMDSLTPAYERYQTLLAMVDSHYD